VTPEHTKTPPAAETHHTTTEKQQIHTNRKKTGVRHTTKKIAIRPTHRKIRDQVISQLAPLDGQFDLQR
jgi:hypothetical protein